MPGNLHETDSSSQKSEVPLADRLRENQRRSRARRKELITELTDKIREYERREAQATIAMQAAARRVLWENERLRDLLAQKGVGDDEITTYLCDTESRGLPAESHIVAQRNYDDNHMSLAAQTIATGSCQRLQSPNANHEEHERVDSSMSCENAAEIIAGLRGHREDEDLVRLKLGCASNQTCKVKNVQVLQVMEME